MTTRVFAIAQTDGPYAEILLLIAVIGLIVFFMRSGSRGLRIIGATVLGAIAVLLVVKVTMPRAADVWYQGQNARSVRIGEESRLGCEPGYVVDGSLLDTSPGYVLEGLPSGAELTTTGPGMQCSPEPWKSAADLAFDADVHPSMAAAAEALAVSALRLEFPSDVRSISSFRVMKKNDRVADAALTRVAQRVQHLRPEWKWAGLEGPSTANRVPPAEEVFLVFNLASYSANGVNGIISPSNPISAGDLSLELRWSSGNRMRRATFVEKSWVEFPAAFSNTNQVLGFSSTARATMEAARQEAIADIADQLLPAVRSGLQRRTHGSLNPDERWLRSKVAQALWTRVDLRDEFSQTLVTPFGGHVSRHAILVHSPSLVERVISDCVTVSRLQRKTWMTMVISAVGMSVLVCAVGLLLNAITKGYYRGRLVVAGGLLLVFGAIVLVV